MVENVSLSWTKTYPFGMQIQNVADNEPNKKKKSRQWKILENKPDI